MYNLHIKNADLYTPAHLGAGDILIIAGRIVAIGCKLIVPDYLENVPVLDAEGCTVIPGLIDGHVHITGGGGEAGFKSQVPPLQMSTIARNGVTTIGAMLGTDDITRKPESVYARACALEEEGITTFMITGGYPVPSPTITQSIRTDIVFIEKVRGGKVAISDNRAAPISIETLARIATEVRVGGMMRNINTVFVLHVGSGAEALTLPLELAKTHPDLGRILLPTHINRNLRVLDEAIELVNRGGYMDISSGLNAENLGPETIKPSRAIARALSKTTAPERVLMSSDANGSALKYDDNRNMIGLTASSLASIHHELRDAVVEEKLPLELVLPVVTKNPALAYGLLRKGEIAVGRDADLVILDADLCPKTTIAQGRILMEDGQVKVRGTFE